MGNCILADQADAEWQKLWTGAQGQSSPAATMVSNSLLVEQPAQGRDGAGDGSMGATVAVILQPTPGKQQQLQADIAEATRILESTGGHVRTWQAIFAGPRAGTVLLASAMPDM
ncbi:MAG TPA: hypothetical protein DEV93_03825, partial [Chloroflexi bacterium]|nr:hypothetical protein [Chloroflexota bacterium]